MTPSLFLTCARGTEDLLARELGRLGQRKSTLATGGVQLEPVGDIFATAMRLCMHVRTASRVLMPLTRFVALDADELYEGAKGVPWEDWLTPSHTICVDATTAALPPLAHGPFLGQKVKDAVCDRLRDKLGARPSVSRDDPDVRLYVNVKQDRQRKGRQEPRVTIGLDVGGRSLHMRGYRTEAGPAPLRETLAAAVVLATGWDRTRPFVDPMCGAGTLAIEAALWAASIAPGLAGGEVPFGFQRWPRFGDAQVAAWKQVREQALAAVSSELPAIFAADEDARAVAMTEANARRAHPVVARALRLGCADMRTLTAMPGGADIVSNPPYGERLGGDDPGMPELWRSMGAHLKKLKGHTAYLLCGSPAMQRHLGLAPSWERRLQNGPIPVSLCRFDLGSPPRPASGGLPTRRPPPSSTRRR